MLEINKVYHGNNLDVLKTFPDNSIDSIVTDPPYGLGKEPNAIEVLQSWITVGYHEVKGKGFMGKEWDAFVPQPNLWKECLRVLKPGGHLLSFAGTRTYDWIVMGLRIAGFEIRDQIAWVYGSGFPKSMDVSKAIDKSMGAEREVVGKQYRSEGRLFAEGQSGFAKGEVNITAPSTDQAKQWQGWGTALKPAVEDVCLAQKPFESSSVLCYNDIKEVAKCLLKSFVNIAEKNLKLNQVEQNAVSNIAQWNVEKSINTPEDLLEVMVMLQSKSMENLNLSIVLLWLNILVELWKAMNIYTTLTELKQTIELKILLSLEWENILENIILQKEMNQNGTKQNVLYAKNIFNVLSMKLDYIKEHFVQENVTLLAKSKDLHPELEDIVMARKPIEGTVAENVLKYGTGAINIDGCRIEFGKENDHRIGTDFVSNGGDASNNANDNQVPNKHYVQMYKGNGRFPANIIHDGSDEVVELFPNDGESSSARFFYTAKASQGERNMGLYGFEEKSGGSYEFRQDGSLDGKIPKRRNIHPTVKPVDLMQYLVRLVTPINGICLDPYLGSGTTAVACKLEGFNYIGIERELDYVNIAEARIEECNKDYKTKSEMLKNEEVKEVFDIFDYMEETK